MERRKTSRSFARGVFALLYSVAPLDSVIVETCDRAPIQAWPPSLGDWCSAAGGVPEVRLRTGSEDWVRAREPLWSPDSLLARPSGRGESARSLHVAWNEITMVERKQRTMVREGIGWGMAVGLGGFAAIALGCAAEGGEDTYGGCGLLALYWFAFGLPMTTTIGAMIGAGHTRWVPIYCSESP